MNSREFGRRGFIGTLSAGALAIAGAIKPGVLKAETKVVPGTDWLRNLHGKYRQVFDAVTPNDAAALGFANAFLMTSPDAYGVPASEVGAVVILRSAGIPWAFNDVIWEKYKLGEMANIEDPKTKKPSIRNLVAKKDPPNTRPGGSIEELVAHGVIFGVCNLATNNRATARASVAGVTADQAKQEWAANLVPGFVLIPSGVWGVNNAQQNGCAYCSAG